MKTTTSLLILFAILGVGTCLAQSEDAALTSRLDVDLYGYFKLDLCYDDAPTATGDYAKWVEPASDEGGDFSGTVNQTRVGLKVRGPKDRRVTAGGKVEIDFYGGGDDPDPRIRHAYVEVSWPEAGVELLVGQTSDVISPLFPSTLNYTVAWFAGNIGFRRPQLRLTKKFDTKGATTLKLEGALTHNIYDTKAGSVTGEDAGFPALQARLSVAFPGPAGTATIGLSGHRAQEDFELSAGETQHCDSWSAGLDLALPVTTTATLKSELWSGASLAPYLGAVGQGVDFDAGLGIHSRGGWVALELRPPRGKKSFAVGLSVDDVDGADLEPGARSSNRSLFGNFIYSLNSHIDLGVELSHWRTEYKAQNDADADALRTQASFFYRF